MKRISVLTAVLICASARGATATPMAPGHLYANGISARNIAAIQHSVTTRAFQSFEGSAAAALGTRAKLGRFAQLSSPAPTVTIKPAAAPADASKLYGRAPVYGTMKQYGEWNDDGTVTRGRSGGDIVALPVLNSAWTDWQHYGDDVKYDHLDRLDTDYDLIMLGVAGGRAMWHNGVSEWGVYTGYVGGSQENKFMDMKQDGGYVGLYGGYSYRQFNLNTSVHGGALSNRAENTFGTDEFSNMWAGAAVNVTYNIAIDDTFTLQPGVYGAYTWIKSANYTADSGHRIQNDNFNMFEVTPGVRAIKQVADGWFATATVKYVFSFENGGKMSINGTEFSELDGTNYSEYGLGIEKSINRFNIALNLGRRDGGRTGWHGGVGMKYIF